MAKSTVTYQGMTADHTEGGIIYTSIIFTTVQEFVNHVDGIINNTGKTLPKQIPSKYDNIDREFMSGLSIQLQRQFDNAEYVNNVNNSHPRKNLPW